jgi:hypothetical protein
LRKKPKARDRTTSIAGEANSAVNQLRTAGQGAGARFTTKVLRLNSENISEPHLCSVPSFSVQLNWNKKNSAARQHGATR